MEERVFRTTVETEIKKTDECNATTGENCSVTYGTPTPIPVVKTDYVIKAVIGVRNKGGDGKLRTGIILKTAEEQFYKEKIVEMKRDEYKTLEFTFDDVSVKGEVGGVGEGKNFAIEHEFRSEPLSNETAPASNNQIANSKPK